MIENKKQFATMRRWLKRQSEAPAKTALTKYSLEPLEARVLLSADLANAVMPVTPTETVPQQAVVLDVPQSSGVGAVSVLQILNQPEPSLPLMGVQSNSQTPTQSGPDQNSGTVDNYSSLPSQTSVSTASLTGAQILAQGTSVGIQTSNEPLNSEPISQTNAANSLSTVTSGQMPSTQSVIPSPTLASSEPLQSQTGQPSSDSVSDGATQWASILQTWKANMLQYGKQHGDLMQSYDAMTGADAATNSGLKLGSTYYDAEKVYYKIAQYTGDPKWLQYGQLAEKFYRDQFVIPNNGQVPGYWNFTSGLLSDYLATGDPVSKSAILTLAQNAGYAQDGASLDWTSSAVYARDVSYAVISYTNAEIVGAPVRERKGELINQLLNYIDQWFVQYDVPPGGEPHPTDYLKPSFVGLAMNSLIYSYEHSPDPRIPTALSVALDGLWDRAWMPDHKAFYYANTEESGTPAFTPAPDLNLLIAPAYAWMYRHTGDVTYLNRGDQVFAGGVLQAYLGGAKQFNQNYEWSFDYVTWRG